MMCPFERGAFLADTPHKCEGDEKGAECTVMEVEGKGERAESSR